METSNVEYKELIILNKKLLLLENVVFEFRNNVKSLKICLNLIKTELNSVKKSKIPVSVSDLHSIQWRYDDFIEIVKRLKTAKKVGTLNKTLSDLENLKQKTENDIKALNEKLNPVSGGANILSSALENTAQILSKKIGQSAQKFGDTITGAVSSKVEEIKKHLAGDEN